jgi:hypothetical protein
MTESAAGQWFIDTEITEGLKRAGLDYDHPVRGVLEKRAVVTGVRDAVVRVRNENGELVTPDEYIKELRNDPRHSALFPQPEGIVAKGDMQRLSENLQAIASGKVIVEK